MSKKLARIDCKELIVQEAEANNQLMAVVSRMRGYKDPQGNGPKDGSLKGIMLQFGIRIIKAYGAKIEEMSPAMLAHVYSTKIDVAAFIQRQLEIGESYDRIKKSCWQFIAARGEKFSRQVELN